MHVIFGTSYTYAFVPQIAYNSCHICVYVGEQMCRQKTVSALYGKYNMDV